MNCDFNNIMLPTRTRRAFTFIEVVTALMIVSVITFGVLVVINQSVASMIENQARIQAFELAREKMENLLASESVMDTAEFGTHETNEDIQWETTIEAFDEPVKSKMWIRAVCSATYTDKNDEKQTIRLEHWLTGLTTAQENQIRDQRKREQDFLDSQDENPFGDDPDGLMQYAQSLAEMGDYAKAAKVSSQLATEYPDSPQASSALSNIDSYANAAAQEGDYTAAAEIAKEVLQNHPDSPQAQELDKNVADWEKQAEENPKAQNDPKDPVPPDPPAQWNSWSDAQKDLWWGIVHGGERPEGK